MRAKDDPHICHVPEDLHIRRNTLIFARAALKMEITQTNKARLEASLFEKETAGSRS
jgi:hypothetical protein